MNNFMKAIDTLTAVINGSENRKGTDRRKNKQRKRKNERRIAQKEKVAMKIFDNKVFNNILHNDTHFE